MKYNKLVKLLTSIIVCEFAGFLGTIFTRPEIGIWYESLKKPFFNPPKWLFGPVWTILYILMGISLYLVWSKNWMPKNKVVLKGSKPWNPLSKKFLSGSWQKANIILIFSVQLALNVLWTMLFFGMHATGLAFFELLMLWFAIIFTIINFYRVSKTSAILLLPYILWVSFAMLLNYFVWILN